MKIVKTVGQAFEVCHKLSLQKNPAMLDNGGDDCSETPCDTSEQDRFSEVISQMDEDEFIPRKGEFPKPFSALFAHLADPRITINQIHGKLPSPETPLLRKMLLIGGPSYYSCYCQ